MRRKPPPREDLPTRPKSFVKPLTLGDIVTNPDTVLEAECEWCRHRGRLEIPPLIDRLGRDTEIRRIQERLRCSVCGWHIAHAYPIGRHTTFEESWEKAAGQGRPVKLPAKPPLDERRAVLRAVPHVPGFAGEQHHAYMRAIMDRWPEVDAGMAFSIVTTLRHELPDK